MEKFKNTVPFASIREIDKKTAEMALNGYIVPPDWADGDTYHSSNSFLKEFNKIDGKYDVIILNMGALYGGVTYEGEVIYNRLITAKSEIHTIVYGLSASMGFKIFLAGKKRSMLRSAQLMAHKAWSWGVGNADDFRKMATDLDKFDDEIKLVTKENSTLSEEQVTEMYKTDTYLTAQEAFDAGICTEIVNGTADQTTDNNASNMKNLLNGGMIAALLNFNQNSQNKPQMTKEEEIAAAVQKAREEEKAALKTALEAKDAEIEKLKNPETTSAEEKENKGGIDKTVLDLVEKQNKLIETLNAKIEKLERTTEKDPPIDQSDKNAQASKDDEVSETTKITRNWRS